MTVFLDTNIFLYAFLGQGSEKKRIAIDCIEKTIQEGNGVISVQVIKEFCNVMLKKSNRTVGDIGKALDIFKGFRCVSGSAELVRHALDVKEQYGIQFFDSLMVVAAEVSMCTELWSEDLNDGQIYCGVRVVNPFNHQLNPTSP